jgi:hypothetical protein
LTGLIVWTLILLPRWLYCTTTCSAILWLVLLEVAVTVAV